MARNRVFFPQEALDAWVVSGVAELDGRELVLKDEGLRYRLTEGARIVREVTGEPEAFDMVGKCKTLGFLNELGADLMETSMILDSNAYEIIPGWLASPVNPIDAPAPRPPTLSSDEELLAQFLAKNM